MALRQNYITSHKLSVSNGYFKIEEYGGYNTGKMKFSVVVYNEITPEKKIKIEPIKNKNRIGMSMYQFEFQPDYTNGVNNLKQAYEYLKTLEQFKNAEDC